MDRGEQWQNWLPNHRISTSPSPYSVQLPDLADSGDSEAGPSNWQGMGGQPNQWHQSEWQPLPDNLYGQQAGTSNSANPRGKRRRRSSSFDDWVLYQGMEGERRGREQHRPPARRQRFAIESENNWETGAGSSMQGTIAVHRRASMSLAPHGYHNPTGSYHHLGGEMGDIPSGDWSIEQPAPTAYRIPPEATTYRNQADDWNNNLSEISYMPTQYPSPARPPLLDELGSGGSGQQHPALHGTPTWPPNWNARQEQDGYQPYPSQGRVRQTPPNYNSPQFYGGANQAIPIHDQSATNNVTNAANVFTGNNYGGYVYMEAASTSDFMLNLADRLKVCFRADYMYHPSGEESALHHTQCTPGTRVNILDGTVAWALNTSPDCECIFWLSGQAGAGKTTITFTIACYFEKLVMNESRGAILGGTFFCSRHFIDTRSASSIIRTLVYHLAAQSPSFRVALRLFGKFDTVEDARELGIPPQPVRLRRMRRRSAYGAYRYGLVCITSQRS